MAARRAPDPATAYAKKVIAGKILAGKLARQACERHLRDLDEASARGLRWRPASAWRAICFFRSLKLTKGKWASQYFELPPWQCFITGNIWGWRREDGLRRFRKGYLEIPRKQGKTEYAGAALLLGGFEDDPPEFAAHNYAAATKRDQAKLVFNAARTMGRRASTLRTRLHFSQKRIAYPGSESFIEPLGRDSENLDGLDPHFTVIDELHAHANSGIVDVLESATGARQQSFMLEITTAGASQIGICWEHHEYSVQILDPASGWTDDAWFAYIAAADDGDAWDDPKTWRKANPNYGVTVPESWFLERLPRWRKSLSARREMERKNLNRWVGASNREIDMETWDRGKAPLDKASLKGRRCFAALDLAKVNDISALALVFPPAEASEPWKVLLYCWCPEDDIEEREHEHRAPYRQWVREGWLVATPGSQTDYDYIEREVAAIAAEFGLKELSYDRHFAEQLQNDLREADLEIEVVPFGQGYVSMAAPTAELLRLVGAGKLQHGGNPVLRWMAGNLVIQKDPAGNMKPTKEKSREKIDGIVALVMGIGRAMITPPEEPSGLERLEPFRA